MVTSMCTTISAGSPPTAIMPGVGFLEKVANLIVNAGGCFVRPTSSDPGTGDITSTCRRKWWVRVSTERWLETVERIATTPPTDFCRRRTPNLPTRWTPGEQQGGSDGTAVAESAAATKASASLRSVVTVKPSPSHDFEESVEL